MFAQQNGDVSDKRYEADNAANDIFFAIQKGLTGCVEFRVVSEVIVPLGE